MHKDERNMWVLINKKLQSFTLTRIENCTADANRCCRYRGNAWKWALNTTVVLVCVFGVINTFCGAAHESVRCEVTHQCVPIPAE